MKIGILTVHRAINVGAVLQCYALQQSLKSLGHEVWVINYVQEKVERTDRAKLGWKYRLSLLKGLHLRGFFFYHIILDSMKGKFDRFDDFLKQYLHCTDKCDSSHLPTDFDAYVIGSDQVWNKKIFGYPEPVFFGRFAHGKQAKLYTYAASTSLKSILEIPTDWLAESVSNFSKISVREQEAADYLNHQFNLPVPAIKTLDPTLLTQREIWSNFKSIQVPTENYIFVYGARPCTKEPDILMRKARELSARHGNLKIIRMDYNKYSPVDFVDLVRNSSYVVSSSFHGIAFALIFNRPLCAVLYGDEQDYRYKDLLQTLEADVFLTAIDDEIKEIEAVDYSKINENREKIMQLSLKYLRNL